MSAKRTFGASTRLCAVIGNPVSHSLSPAIHNAGYEALGLDFVYIACRVEDVKSALAGMRALENFRGLSVTIPHKIEVMNHVDEINDVDRSIGSINTVIHEGENLIGLGTDGPGALKAIRDAGVATEGKKVLMLGAGGASRAISFTLAKEAGPDSITLLDLNREILDGLASDLGSSTDRDIKSALFDDNALAASMEEAHIIIHCTPVGMHPKEDASLVPQDLMRPGQVFFDIVYTPLETKLLADAKAKGLQTISGVEMFVNQAVLQFEQFTGVDAPEEVMRRVVMENLTK
ncbi:MAG: shikimate dehydrogenase [Deltaproteobacteria bacterium]|nr:shikimate dehydrogenase [Deltaproteobacteria bacterium]